MSVLGHKQTTHNNNLILYFNKALKGKGIDVSQVPGYEVDDRDSVCGMSRGGVCVSPFTD